MELKKSTVIGLIGAVGALVFFFLSPWHFRNVQIPVVGSVGFGFMTGLDLAVASRPWLYLIPIAAVLGVVACYAKHSDWLEGPIPAGVLLVLGIAPTVLIVFKLSELGESLGPVTIGQTGWGVWATIAALVVMALSGVFSLVSAE